MLSFFLLAPLYLFLAGAYLAYRRKERRQWKRVERTIETILKGQTPPSFIFHGDPAWQRIGTGLEALSEQRERLQRQITEDQFNLRTVLAYVAEGILIVDTRGQIRLFNPAFETLFGLKTSPLGKTVTLALENAEIETVIRQALEQGETLLRELALPSPEGLRQLAVSVSPVRRSNNSILGGIAIFRDITRLTQLEQVRREFVANVSHELRTPLSIFQGYLEILSDNPDMTEEERRPIVETLQRHSHRLNLLVEDLLTLARLESRREKLNLESVCMGELLRDIQRDWNLRFSDKEVTLQLQLAEELPRIQADRARMEQVMNNLLENALKFTPAKGKVVISAAPANGRLEIRVQDNGAGIPAGDLPHIFERFYRADKARNRAGGGTGLGLSIVKHLVQIHQGSVRAESQEGRGTTIIIELPAEPHPPTDDARNQVRSVNSGYSSSV